MFAQRISNLIACAALLASNTGIAHDFWIEPDNFRPAPEEPVELRLREGVDFKGNTLPFIPEWFSDFSKTTTKGREAIESIPGDDPAAIIVARNGATLIGYRSNRAFVELPAEKFNSYLDEEGMEFIRKERIARGEDDKPAPEYFVRCAKTLLQTGPADASQVFGTKLGYTLELTPLSNPYSLQAGDKLTFRLDYRGKPARDLLVQAFTAENPTVRQRIRTNSKGEAVVTVTEPGTWMIKAVNIQPIIGDPQAKWQSYWASFLFELPNDD
jgi:Domain of unknown function (DUF4198)